jgi:hypothetical protein
MVKNKTVYATMHPEIGVGMRTRSFSVGVEDSRPAWGSSETTVQGKAKKSIGVGVCVVSARVVRDAS